MSYIQSKSVWVCSLLIRQKTIALDWECLSRLPQATRRGKDPWAPKGSSAPKPVKAGANPNAQLSGDRQRKKIHPSIFTKNRLLAFKNYCTHPKNLPRKVQVLHNWHIQGNISPIHIPFQPEVGNGRPIPCLGGRPRRHVFYPTEMERFNQCHTLFNNSNNNRTTENKKTHDFQTENDIATLDWIETGFFF